MRNLNNTVQLIGRIGSEYKVLHEQGDSMIISNSIAVHNKYKNSKGEMVEETDWFTFKLYNKTAANAKKYTKKGDMVILEGRLATEKYTNKEGVDRYVTLVKVKNVMYL